MVEVSVIIPTYGIPKTLRRAINSVLEQSYDNLEVIIIDDNEPNSNAENETTLLMNEYAHNNKVRYIKQPQNLERSAARNRGIDEANGEYLMFLDNDDKFLPDKIRKSVERIRSLDESYGVVYSSYVRIQNGKKNYYSAEKREGDLLLPCLCRDLMVHAGSNLLVKKKVAVEVGGFPLGISSNEDIIFLAKILDKYKIGYVDIIGIEVYIQKSGYRRDVSKSTIDFLKATSHLHKKLSDDEKKLVNNCLSIQVARYYLTTKRYSEAIRICKDNKVSLSFLFQYLLYAVRRIKSNKAFGFIKS